MKLAEIATALGVLASVFITSCGSVDAIPIGGPYGNRGGLTNPRERGRHPKRR